MKKKLALALLGFAVLVGGNVFAQNTESPFAPISESVKILPTEKQGIIKVLYALESESPVAIKFFTRDGEIGSDQVTRDQYEKGFLRWYDISHIESPDFSIEVSSDNMTVKYRIVKSKNSHSFEPILERVTYNEVITASRKSVGKN